MSRLCLTGNEAAACCIHWRAKWLLVWLWYSAFGETQVYIFVYIFLDVAKTWVSWLLVKWITLHNMDVSRLISWRPDEKRLNFYKGEGAVPSDVVWIGPAGSSAFRSTVNISDLPATANMLNSVCHSVPPSSFSLSSLCSCVCVHTYSCCTCMYIHPICSNSLTNSDLRGGGNQRN